MTESILGNEEKPQSTNALAALTDMPDAMEMQKNHKYYVTA